MKRISILIVFVFVFVAVGQEIQHAPTVAQCQADQRLWDYQLINQSEKLPDIEVLQKWNSELRDCMKADPQNRLQYFITVDEVDGETLLRMMHFLQRHNTLKDFVNEDDAGKR
jgi:hypothetical protein